MFDDEVWASTGIVLTKLVDDFPATSPLASYQSRIRQWVGTYLTTPHPELGRDGPVCPFTATAINKQLFWVGCVDRLDLTAIDIENTVAGLTAVFQRLQPARGPEAVFKTILIVFPTITDYGLIDEAQRRLKEKFVSMGLMIGQFYPGCEEPGIRNPQFRPLQSPVALLAIRHMVSSDFPFLSARAEWVEEYRKRFTAFSLAKPCP